LILGDQQKRACLHCRVWPRAAAVANSALGITVAWRSADYRTHERHVLLLDMSVRMQELPVWYLTGAVLPSEPRHSTVMGRACI